ncbi:MAG: HdeA/HdeB family chaperone [Pseudomonadota bacterium]
MKQFKQLLAAFALSFAVIGATQADGHMADIEAFKCRDLLVAGGDERDLAVMFLQGYFVGKSGETVFDRDVLAAATDRFLEMCVDAPDEKAVDVMGKALKAAAEG